MKFRRDSKCLWGYLVEVRQLTWSMVNSVTLHSSETTLFPWGNREPILITDTLHPAEITLFAV